MRHKILSLSLILGFAALHSGCEKGPDYFPQYTGSYLLAEPPQYLVSYNEFESKPAIKGMDAPGMINVVHRMEWDDKSSHWAHKLYIKAIPLSNKEADGDFSLDLRSLINDPIPCSSGTGCSAGGIAFRPGKGTHQNPTFGCSFEGYAYTVRSRSGDIIPSPELFVVKDYFTSQKLIYAVSEISEEVCYGDEKEVELNIHGQNENLGAIKMENPEDACVAPDAVAEWEKQIKENDGITITLRVEKSFLGDISGCSDPDYPGYLEGADDQDTGQIVLVYKKSKMGDQDQETDLRSEGLDGIRKRVKNLFLQVSNFI